MALTDEQIQDIQEITKESASQQEGAKIQDQEGRQYEVVASMDDTTQAISVAPIINGEPDYNQTAIVVAGTQPLGDENGNGFWDEVESLDRALFQAQYGYSF